MILRARRAIATCFAFLIIALIAAHLRHKHNRTNPISDTAEPPPSEIPAKIIKSEPYTPPPCSSPAWWLKTLDIPFPVKYARREIVVRSNPSVKRNSITKIKEPLFGDFQTLDPTKDDSQDSQLANCMPPLYLDVPAFSTTPPNASHLLLGAATTLSRLEASLPYFQRWLAHTHARLIVIVTGPDDKPPDPITLLTLQTHMRSLGLSATLVPPYPRRWYQKPETFPERYFSLTKLLATHLTPETHWIGLIDDDTFFTSLPALLTSLAKYDHTTPLYLGALSEEWWTVITYGGFIPMGGAGIFLSPPLLRTLSTHHDTCLKTSQRIFGDHKIYECVEKHTPGPIRLISLNGLYQIDVHGDRSGIFESGRQILTLHHWKEGYWSEDGSGADAIRHSRWFPMDEMALVSSVCGADCFLQRWQFGPDTLLANGYSISTYPQGELSKPSNVSRFDKMERTWVTPVVVEGTNETDRIAWDHYLGPLRRKMVLEREKVPWRFLRAEWVGGPEGVGAGGAVRQLYRHLGRRVGGGREGGGGRKGNGTVEEGEGEREMDSLLEVVWVREEGFVEENGGA